MTVSISTNGSYAACAHMQNNDLQYPLKEMQDIYIYIYIQYITSSFTFGLISNFSVKKHHTFA